ncbi:hypothetical protein [Phytohabitans kaempferiae]|uniref:Uncharacterized protein n=1 Tax=Phytohabitans kaempferiae TaxID=1620943 RepID=A0ABV6MGG4_9ACTN
MNPTDPASAREEAERLVATVLATVSSGRGFGSFFGAPHEPGPMATGSAECCVCPLCRAIAAMRDPNPQFAERVATGAGDFAAGVASLLRSLSVPPPAPPTGQSPTGQSPTGQSPTGQSPTGQSPTRQDGPTADSGSRDDEEDVWRAATRASHDPGPE